MQGLVDGCSNEVINEEPNAGKQPLKKCASKSSITLSPDGCFECNICLDFAADPVVTLCGHLYCWPCIYKWLRQSASTSLQQCPVCKTALSQDNLVPLYGRGNNRKTSYEGVDIPHRPSICRGSSSNQSTRGSEGQYQSIQSRSSQPLHSYQQDYAYVNSSSGYMLPYTPLGTFGVLHSTAGGFLAGMALEILPLIFRNQQFSDMHSSSPYYASGANGSPRLRRRELELQRSLNQIWLFLFCCAILCLLLF